jgi:sarcosine oxidase
MRVGAPPPYGVPMDYEVIIAGLGAMGSAAAYQVSRRGRRVLGLDAFAPGHTRGSSHGESRIIRLAYFEHPDYVPLLRRAYDLWGTLEQESETELLRLTGGLYVGAANSPLVAGSLRSARDHGLGHEVLDSGAIRRRFPGLRPNDDQVGVYEAQAGVLFPERCIAAYLRLAAAAGADLRHEQPLRRWAVSRDGVEVETDSGRFRAERLVLTAGAWLGSLSNVPLPLAAERNAVFWFQPVQTPDLFDSRRFPIFIWDTGDAGHYYGVPHLDWPGVKVGLHHSGHFCDPETVDRQVSADDEAPVRRFVARAIPALNGPVTSSVVCLYTNTPDEHFVVDRHPEFPQVVLAGGFSGHGFKFASVVGEIVADLAVHGQATPAAGFLSAARFRKAGG